MQKLSGLRGLKRLRTLVRSASTATKTANPKPSSDAGDSTDANLKIAAGSDSVLPWFDLEKLSVLISL